MKSFTLKVYTQQKEVFVGKAVSLIFPATTGFVGIMADHAPFAAVIGEGPMTVKLTSDDERIVKISGGFFETHDNVMTVLADCVEKGLEPSTASE